ncbi:MAG TPA: hypothetical protein VF062_09975 [Candidatus Limnocylindrales bacterium]
MLEYAYRFASDYDLIWWIPAEQPSSAVAALAALAVRVGVGAADDQAQAAEAVLEWLRGLDRWLLIYDNAESPDGPTGLLPRGGEGHVLVTSRWSAWKAQASALPLDVMDRPESIEFLRRRTGVPDEEAQAWSQLADLVGDLPLALEEASSSTPRAPWRSPCSSPASGSTARSHPPSTTNAPSITSTRPARSRRP